MLNKVEDLTKFFVLKSIARGKRKFFFCPGLSLGHKLLHSLLQRFEGCLCGM